ncbi:MAG TPA: hypothetical protein DDY17_10115 [Syntrophaceae bacterium]|nr:hypothetical protein [Syntrophaceae bacterium]
MYQNTYRIRRSFVIPFSIDVFLLFILLLLSIFLKGSHVESTTLIIIFIAALYVYIESLYRMVQTGDQGIMIRKVLRKKELRWEDVTHVGALTLRKKAYLLLTTVKGFHILSNAYEKYSSLTTDIISHLDKEKVEEEVRNQQEHPVKNVSDIVMTWFTAVVLLGIITIKLFNS